MRLQKIEFGPCLDAAGVRGWTGEGYRHHRFMPWLSFEGSTFVAKTTTLPPRIPPEAGILPIESTFPYAPKEVLPKCIWFDLASGRTLNAVGLSGPGAKVLLSKEILEKYPQEKPFQFSFMSVEKTAEERLVEFKKFIILLLSQLKLMRKYKLVFGLQINISCPNTGLDPAHLVDEAITLLDAAQPLTELGIPIIIKLNVLAPIKAVVEIANHRNCNAICVSNTIPFGALPERIAWKKIFPHGSPLKLRDPNLPEGGYSGPELLSLVGEFIYAAKLAGVKKPWNAGGGIRHPRDVGYLVEKAKLSQGRDSIFIGSAAMVRPHQVLRIIRAAHRLLG